MRRLVRGTHAWSGGAIAMCASVTGESGLPVLLSDLDGEPVRLCDLGLVGTMPLFVADGSGWRASLETTSKGRWVAVLYPLGAA
jgi:hypothetical protein